MSSDDGQKPPTIHDTKRSPYPTLKANVTGDSGAVLTEEMLIRASVELPIAMQRMAAARHEFRAEWWPIVHWLYEQKRNADGYRLGMIVGMMAEMGPPFMTNTSGYDFMQKVWHEYQDREKV